MRKEGTITDTTEEALTELSSILRVIADEKGLRILKPLTALAPENSEAFFILELYINAL